MPPLDQVIDHKNTLNGTISAHSQHLIISTGRSDWMSRIEDESENGTSWGKVVGDLKTLLGRKGEFHDVRPMPVPPCSESH
jgi:prenyl protein peptidase